MTRTERTYYLVSGLYSLPSWFLAPVYALFLLHCGLDLFQMNVVLATFLITSSVFEVPTGAVADLVGRKVSFVLSCVVRMAAFTLYAFAGSFGDCVRAEFIDAIGFTLASGALDAWAIDGTRAEGDRRPPDRLFARAQTIARILMIVGGVACGYLAAYDFALPWFVAAAGFGVTALVAAAVMRETRPASSGPWTSVHRSVGRRVRDGFASVRTAPVLLLLCLLSLAIAFGALPAHMLWQPRIQALTGEGAWLMGWIWGLINVACALGSAAVPLLLGHFSRERVLAVVALWRGGMLAVAGIASGVFPALIGLLFQEVGFGLSEPLLQAWMNEHIAPERRATVLSVRAMCFTLGGGAGLVCIGLVARAFGIPAAWLVSAAVLALTAPGFLILGRLARRDQRDAAGVAADVAAAKLSPSALG